MKYVHSALLVAAVFTVSVATAADQVAGRVVDTGLSEPNSGIAGVSIVITALPSGQKLGEGITQANGGFKIDVKGYIGPAEVSYSKVGYFERPTRVPMAMLTAAVPTVRLSQATASNEYYKAIAENIWKAKEGGAFSINSFQSAVSSLPAKERTAVLTELKLNNINAYEDFIVGDKTYQSASGLMEAIKSNEKAGYKLVYAAPNYSKPGTITLYGAVPSATDRKSVEDLAKNFGGIKGVQNDILVYNK